MCRGEQWSSFLGQLLGLNEALSNGMDMCWGRRMVMSRGEQWSSFLGQLLGLNEALDLQALSRHCLVVWTCVGDGGWSCVEESSGVHF